jgi:DNA-binding PadR family transcriptional regulator
MAVLGLVIERPDQTVAWYANVLAQRFPRARFGKPTAYNALRQMETSNSPRVRRTHEADAEGASKDRYEATPEGLHIFQAWMFQPPTATPAVRQALYGRIGLARLEDLPGLVEVVRQEEAIATSLYKQANEALRAHQIRKRSRGAEGKTRADFERDIHETWLDVGPLHWSSRATLCLTVLDRLEDIAEEAGISVDPGEDADEEHRHVRAG